MIMQARRQVWAMRPLFAILVGVGFVSDATLGSNPEITLQGSCPGRLTVSWNGAPANEFSVICFAGNVGRYNLPIGPCEGTVLGLGNQGLRVVSHFSSGPEGEGLVSGHAAPIGCGGYLQMVVVVHQLPCPISNVVQIPQ